MSTRPGPGVGRMMIATIIAMLGVTSCGSSPSLSPTSPSATPTVSLDDAARCPVTKPGPGPVEAGDQFSRDLAFGNGQLWVAPIQPDGIELIGPRSIEPDGWMGVKFGWWREVPGALAISGRRLDAAAPSARALIPDGYGTLGFQSSGVAFPAEGCWEITGTVGASSLTFVTFVIRAADVPSSAP